MREEGFYWVRLGDGTPEVGSWENGRWWLTGNEVPFDDDQVRVLSERLIPPT
jgi:hypothetical protein